MKRRSVAITFGLVLMGTAIVVASRFVGKPAGEGWWTDLLMGVGSGVALFGPFYWITQNLDRHITAVETETAKSVERVRTESAAQAAELSTRVQQIEIDVERRLADVAANVSDRLEREADADASAIEKLRVATSRDGVMALWKRSCDRGLITMARPPRVMVAPEEQLFISLLCGPADGDGSGLPIFRVEECAGAVVGHATWASEQSIDDVMFTLGQALERLAGARLDVPELFAGFADLLDVAASEPALRPAVELSPPQWVLTTSGANTYGPERRFPVSLVRLGDPRAVDDVVPMMMVHKESFDQVQRSAIALFPGATALGRMEAALRDARS